MTQGFSHVDDAGRPQMVDITRKDVTLRTATARCRIELPPETLARLRDADFRVGKGPVIDTAIIAATQAVKRTHELIPFCHALPIERCRVIIECTSDSALEIECEVSARARTGVEMEALTGAAVAALTVYDMCKSLGHAMTIGGLRVLAKRGGTRDFDEAQT